MNKKFYTPLTPFYICSAKNSILVKMIQQFKLYFVAIAFALATTFSTIQAQAQPAAGVPKEAAGKDKSGAAGDDAALKAGVVTATGATAAAGDIGKGKELFTTNCISCHQVLKKGVGPALTGVTGRHSHEWLVKWIHNSTAMIKAGDPEAVAISNEFGGAVMTAFPNLSDAQITDILAYVESVKPVVAPPPTPGQEKASTDNTTLYILLLLISIFLIVYVVLGRVRTSLRRMHAEKAPEEYAEERTRGLKAAMPKKWRGMNPVVLLLFIVTGLAILIGGWAYNYAITEVGRQQGYAPTQPINFSHKLHAGDMAINCRYCHSSVESSKNASIPSLNTCMNCHKGVTLEDKYAGKVSPEIQKIYTALDYDPERPAGQQYGPNPAPIRWIRIHNLPDHAYFNHSQHVKVGKLACQSCHGAVEKMETVQQVSTLQMGWCIDCHRTTGIQSAGNNYYKALHEKASADLKKNSDKSKYFGPDGKVKITPALNGGTECSKCHY